MSSDTFNVGQLLTSAANQWPDHAAVAEPDGQQWKSVSFQQLEDDCNRIANGLIRSGVKPGMRLALLVPPGIDFVAMVFALYKAGAVIILIDPGIGRKNLVKCLSAANPQGIVGIAKAQIARWIFRRKFPDAKLNFVVGRKSWPGCKSVENFRFSESEHFEQPENHLDDDASIIFTSGSTGAPKGVLYSHKNFIQQTKEIRDYFDIQPGGADISGFPLFALFNTAMGKTTVFPRMNFTRPADVAPEEFLRACDSWNADQSFGSPALWNTVSRWCEKNGRQMTTIKRVMSAGAPVPDHVLKRVRSIIASDGEVYTPYGATEALPVACNSASIVLGETAAKTHEGKGVCVGGRFKQIAWKVIGITDEPIATIDDALVMPTGQIGELVVQGPVVTRQYVTRTEANALHKVSDGNEFWHRMGDVGYLDEHNRFWMCGRKSQRVITDKETLFTVPCESIINTHPAIYRSALVGIGPQGSQVPAIVAEPWPEHWPANEQRRTRLIDELKDLASNHDLTRNIQTLFLRKALPVDIRHNAKIFREQIAVWAGQQAAAKRR